MRGLFREDNVSGVLIEKRCNSTQSTVSLATYVFTVSRSSGNTAQNLSAFYAASCRRSQFVDAVPKLLRVCFKSPRLIWEQVCRWEIKKATQCNRPSLINHPQAHGAPCRHDADPTEGVTGTGGGERLDDRDRIEVIDVFDCQAPLKRTAKTSPPTLKWWNPLWERRVSSPTCSLKNTCASSAKARNGRVNVVKLCLPPPRFCFPTLTVNVV